MPDNTLPEEDIKEILFTDGTKITHVNSGGFHLWMGEEWARNPDDTICLFGDIQEACYARDLLRGWIIYREKKEK